VQLAALALDACQFIRELAVLLLPVAGEIGTLVRLGKKLSCGGETGICGGNLGGGDICSFLCVFNLSVEFDAVLLLLHASSAEIGATAVANGMITLREDGWHKVALGHTSIEEILRVVA